MNIFKILKKGIVNENPVFIQLIGMCPTLGVTTNAINGLSMGLATALVLIGSNIAISLLKKVIPDEIRIPAFIVIIATFVTVIGMLLEAYLPDVNKTLGLYIPLIVVNCLILARAEAFAFKNNVGSSAFDGLGMGLGFTVGLTILGAIREILGAGQLFGKVILGASYQPALIFILPPGAFIVLGLLIAGINKYTNSKKKAESNC
ncbi:electron transport complex protein, subunit E [Gottschalkia acidurici 9a]|uniref:Ion-translocating oxidoreductase complex subunit E n=1 Tax=Gottschalkia acidurici (strain ATCC 7906 / DSM 604 / BCRC 14475 / CIP 104303 / KCTC 5404 / NCIMB 10678 / 9a) TaxID=1128398 RepID=K0AXU9_GOTA9|nr:electron transport complex subunit E [Gottschalkia acidurici]AFS78014.1 electron transport complex protein, subunit E [Gottschalkia acidurici 9a]